MQRKTHSFNVYMQTALMVLLLLACASTAQAQDYKLRADYSNNWFNANGAFALDPIGTSCAIGTGTYSTETVQAIGSNTFFAIGADQCSGGSADACNRWNAANVAFNTINTYTFVCCNNGASNFSTAPTIGRYYTTRIEHNGYANIRAVVSETANTPVSFTNVSATDNLVYGCLSAAPSTNETVFIRYRIKPAGTWQTIQASLGNGVVASTANSASSCFTATVPGAAGQDFEFYALTSTAADAATVQTDPDLWTLRDYGTDANGQVSGAGCPKMDNFLTRTTVNPYCVAKGGAVIALDGTVDAGQYQYITETQHAAPLLPETNDANAAANSDFVGESSARIVTYGANIFDYTNYNDIQASGWGTADIKKLHVSWDATYLYLAVEGPSADKYFGAGSLDRMDLFVAIDKDDSRTSNVYQNNIKLAASQAPWNKRVDFNGWTPEYFVAIDRVGPNPSTAGQGKNLGAGFFNDSDHGDYAALYAAGNATPLAEERNMSALGVCPSFDVVPNFADMNNGIHEIRVPWTSIGGRPDIYTGQRMNFAVYTTYDEVSYDTYDTGPGLGQGHGKPFEQIGDTPWDGDYWGGYADPVQGTTDYPAQNNFTESINADPFDSRVRDNGPGNNVIQGQQPGSDNSSTNGASVADFDTVEGYYSVSNVGQIASKVDCSLIPDGGANPASAACSVAIPPASTGTFTETTNNTNPIITASNYITNGGALSITDGGGCYAETITIAANDVQSNPLNATCVNCPANSYGTTVRTYTITDNSQPTTSPAPTCITPLTFGATLTTCTTQTFTRTAVNFATPLINSTPTLCSGTTYSITVNATVASGTVEYAIDGGAYQASNVFGGLASGSTHSITVRTVGSTDCVATASGISATCCAANQGMWVY